MNTRQMKTSLCILGIFLFSIANANEGEQLYKATCAACHTIGKGRLVGPDLQNIKEKRSQEWLLSFIKSSASMVNSGDADAKAIFEEYNKLLMPDNNYWNLICGLFFKLFPEPAVMPFRFFPDMALPQLRICHNK